jgi:hypothetical protein
MYHFFFAHMGFTRTVHNKNNTQLHTAMCVIVCYSFFPFPCIGLRLVVKNPAAAVKIATKTAKGTLFALSGESLA